MLKRLRTSWKHAREAWKSYDVASTDAARILRDSSPSYGSGITERNAVALSGVWSCVRLLAGTVSTLPISVYQRNGKLMQELPDHPVSVLLNSPSFEQSTCDWLDFKQQSLDLHGNAYSEIKRNGAGEITSLIPVYPELMHIKRQPSGKLVYSWWSKGKRRELEEKNVFHVRGPGGDSLGGASVIRLASQTFSAASASAKVAHDMFKKKMQPSSLLKYGQTGEFMSAEQREQAYKNLSERFEQVLAGNGTLILEGGMEYIPLGISPADAQLIETRGFDIEEICRFFLVPPVLIGHTSKSSSWPSSVEQQALQFLKFSLRQRLTRFEQATEKQLLSLEERRAGVMVRFNVDALLRGDSLGRAKFYQIMRMIGGMTVNEVRADNNLPPVEGGDDVHLQMQNVPLA